MRETEVVIGLDIGTTSTKAVVFGPRGVIRATHEIGYTIHHPHPTWAEQDPDVIVDAAIDAIRYALLQSAAQAKDVLAVGISSAMHSLIAVDADGRPLTKSIIWADNRSMEQANHIRHHLDGHQIYRRTGTPIHPMSPLPKLMWLKEKSPEVFNKAAKFISIKEYLLYQFFHRYVIDYSLASATGLFNLRERRWDREVLQLLGLEESQLSEPVPTVYCLTQLETTIAARIGIHPETPFIVGASDGVLANLGVGAIQQGEMAITIGTSGAIRTVVPSPKTDEKGRTFCYALTDQHWVVGGPTNNGGMMLRWLRDEFAAPEMEVAKRLGVDAYELMIQYAENVPAGSDGLLFLPFLTGERAPYWNPNARGTFFGISIHHKREHFIRAVLEGVIFSVFSVGVVLRELTGEIKDVRASGGFARSAVWRQILADVMGREIMVPVSHEASALGAATLALYGVGKIERLEQVNEWINISHRHQPNQQNSEIYLEMFYLYSRLYEKLKDEFEVAAKLRLRGEWEGV
ncbi:gluconokinase [Desmospora activa]|uniref:Gluconate kinase (FGGY family) n=1 Tax=Desmospora activa DSM 45169 TaxID=1121389 RepID=A0A2T4Z9M2_9BACL|nr:gluconokinase [Desmospora activa]PTM58565.1 gluconate kinase (FGGY family) [Desmospora activa DSM 45169]